MDLCFRGFISKSYVPLVVTNTSHLKIFPYDHHLYEVLHKIPNCLLFCYSTIYCMSTIFICSATASPSSLPPYLIIQIDGAATE